MSPKIQPLSTMLPPIDEVPKLYEDLLKFLEYLSTISKSTDSENKKARFEKCSEIVADFVDVLSNYMTKEFSFIEVFLMEFEAFPKEILDKIKSESKNFTDTSNLFVTTNLISRLSSALETNIFIAHGVKYLSSGNNETLQNLPKELADYLKIGLALKDEADVLNLKRDLSKLKFSQVENLKSASAYYAALIGPSFMGKTQTAFTLSHVMNVIYVNFMGSDTTESSSNADQPIYKHFEKFSSLFFKAVEQDLLKTKNISAKDISRFNPGFKTLGLLYCLIRMKHLKPTETVEERFLRMLNIKTAIVPALNVGQFIEKMKELGISLDEDEDLVFIDEFPGENLNTEIYSSLVIKIKFLRNLSRSVFLPSILSGTDSTATNLIGKMYIKSSGFVNDPRKWVKVIVKPIQATLKSLCCTLKFMDCNGVTVDLADFVNDDGSIFKFDEFRMSLYGKEQTTIHGLDSAISLLKLVFKHSKTGLPGFYFEALKSIVEFFIKVRKENVSLSQLFGNLISDLCKKLYNRKRNLSDSDSVLASVHILSFPSVEQIANEKGEVAAKKVNQHFYYFGNHGDVSFDLELQIERTTRPSNVNTSNIDITNHEDKLFYLTGMGQLLDAIDKDRVSSKQTLFRNGNEFEQSCHFSQIYDDFFLTYSLWSIWFGKKLNEKFTLANLYKKYLKSKGNYYVQSSHSVPNAFSFELLSFWAVAYASHKNAGGTTLGASVLDEFMKSMQIFDDEIDFNFKEYEVPRALDSFLKKITVPYLICGTPSSEEQTKILEADDSDFINADEAKAAKEIRRDIETVPQALASEKAKIDALIAEMAQFVSIGTCYRPKSNVGWDVMFEMLYNGTKSVGYIECKLWSSPVGLPLMFPYYKKACLNGFKFSILVASKIQASLSGEKASKKLTPNPTVSKTPKPPAESSLPARDLSEFNLSSGPLGKRESIRIASKRFESLAKSSSENIAEFAKRISDKIVSVAKKAKTEKSPVPEVKDYEEMLNELWENADNEINIYTISFRKETDAATRTQNGIFEIGKLKEFKNPKGVFIIMESSFNPPKQSSSS